jgi:hypothetical protein
MGNREILSYTDIDDFERLLRSFIYDIQICSDNIELIIEKQNQGVNLIPIKDFLGHYVYLCYSLCTINAYKIFYKEEKTSFHKLINKIHDFRYDRELTEHFKLNSTKDDSEKLTKSRAEFKTLATELFDLIKDKEGLINKFREKRHSFYAHHDPSKNVEPETLDEVKGLCQFSKIYLTSFMGSSKAPHLFLISI